MATPRSQSSLSSSSPSLSSQVRVVLRVRPFLDSEIVSDEGNNPLSCISVLEKREQDVTIHIKDQFTSRNECYKLDSYFGQEDHVDQIFYREVHNIIPSIFKGSNATVFAYGATGSGKTYTMQGTDEEPGLIPLSMSTILSLCLNCYEAKVEIAYYEVYLDRCYDLLVPKVTEIIAMDDKDGRVQLKGLSWVEVHTMDEFHDVFSTGVQRRKVAHTGLNDVSSRSHAVLSIAISNCNVKGKLNLIDLAGNEDNRKTGNTGIRLQESAKINQSLFALSNVIYALNNNDQRIPYRESKLTRLLQDSLGGTSRALMVACLNPISYKEAVNTVSLAARSRHIVNYVDHNKEATPREKIDMEAKLRAWLESKGKTMSTQRSRIFSPSSMNYSKNSELVRSSVKSKPTGRKLFDTTTTQSKTTMEGNLMTTESFTEEEIFEIISYENQNCENESLSNSHYFKETDSQEVKDSSNDSEIRDTLTEIFSQEVKESNIKNEVHDTPNETDSQEVKDSNNKNVVHDTPNETDSQEVKDSINKNEVHSTPSKMLVFNQLSDVNQDQISAVGLNVIEQYDFLDSERKKENLQSPMKTKLANVQDLSNSLRKVMSPIDLNAIAPNAHQSPKTPFVSYKAQNSAKTLDKYDALSTNLKESLVEKYLAFLNVASREDLLQLKGIGEKRADYILELRENNPEPLKSLSDLEKIGLSSKQVQWMFKSAARGFFA